MVRHDLPIVTVVMNNVVWGMSIHGQEAMYGPNGAMISRLADTRYDEVAQGFGCDGATITELDDLAPAIEAAFARRRPTCLNVHVDGEVIAPATLSLLGGLEPEPGDIIVPYYENIKP